MPKQEFLIEQARQRNMKAGRAPRNGYERTARHRDATAHHIPHVTSQHATPQHSTSSHHMEPNSQHDHKHTAPHPNLAQSYPFTSIWIRHPGFNNPWNSGGGRRVSDGRNRYENFRHNKQDLYRNGSDQSISSRSTRENTHVPRKRVSRDERQQYGNQKRYRRSKSTIDDTIL